MTNQECWSIIDILIFEFFISWNSLFRNKTKKLNKKKNCKRDNVLKFYLFKID